MFSLNVSKAFGKKTFLLVTILVLFAATLPVNEVVAQPYPSKPIRLIVPFTPGGTTDILSRILGQKLSEVMGVQVVIDNRPGAAGNIGAELAAKAAPDGYTLLMGPSGTLAVNPSLYANLPFDPIRDFAPISLVAMVPSILVVHPSLPVKSVKELIEYVKSRPGQLNYGSSGAGGQPFLAVEYLKLMAGLNIVEVRYKGGAPLTTDLIAGQISLTITGIPTLLPHIKSGRLRALAVSSAKRSAAVPELPTISEAALPGYDATAWYGVLAPAGTPKEIIARLNVAINKSIKHPDVAERLTAEGAETVGNTPEEFAAFIKSESESWAKVIKAAGVKVQ
jgi:tripartite-type tricarboxylate transporter receptor subunit TctC